MQSQAMRACRALPAKSLEVRPLLAQKMYVPQLPSTWAVFWVRSETWVFQSCFMLPHVSFYSCKSMHKSFPWLNLSYTQLLGLKTLSWDFPPDSQTFLLEGYAFCMAETKLFYNLFFPICLYDFQLSKTRQSAHCYLPVQNQCIISCNLDPEIKTKFKKPGMISVLSKRHEPQAH